MFDSIYNSDSNVLVCAPTGAGKTIIALLSMLRVINQNRSKETGEINTEDFKIVYIAPMKALVNEIVATLKHRLNHLGMKF